MTAATALDKHPQKGKISLTLLPMAREILSSVDNVAVDNSELLNFTRHVTKEMGFDFDMSLLD